MNVAENKCKNPLSFPARHTRNRNTDTGKEHKRGAKKEGQENMPESVREEKKDEHEKEKEDIADPEALQMSQTCWEFKSLLKSTDIASQRQPPQQPSVARLRQIGTKSKADGSTEVVGRSSKRLKVQSPSVNEPRSSVKSLSPSVARSFAPSRSTTTRLQDARNQHQAEGEKTSSTWDMFVLVLQCSDLQRIASKTGYEIDLSTLLVADPTASFFGVTLWRGAAQWGARIIRAGDLVRLNRCARSLDKFSTSCSCPTMSFQLRPVVLGLRCHAAKRSVQYKVFVSVRSNFCCCRC